MIERGIVAALKRWAPKLGPRAVLYYTASAAFLVVGLGVLAACWCVGAWRNALGFLRGYRLG